MYVINEQMYFFSENLPFFRWNNSKLFTFNFELINQVTPLLQIKKLFLCHPIYIYIKKCITNFKYKN